MQCDAAPSSTRCLPAHHSQEAAGVTSACAGRALTRRLGDTVRIGQSAERRAVRSEIENESNAERMLRYSDLASICGRRLTCRNYYTSSYLARGTLPEGERHCCVCFAETAARSRNATAYTPLGSLESDTCESRNHYEADGVLCYKQIVALSWWANKLKWMAVFVGKCGSSHVPVE